MAAGRRQYPFHLIEPKWQRHWDEHKTFRAWNPGESVPAAHPFAERHGQANPASLPKFYILDMFPYPSGAGLHVGHPEGYTATDILARYKRAQGLHVLHPMGWDAFGLPAEQYAIKTGQHPRQTTERNVDTFRRQIKALGFSYDWSREIDTTDPEYFKWTQWIFLKLYNSWFNPTTNKAEPIETLPISDKVSDKVSGQGPPTAPGVLAEVETRRRAYRDSKRLAYVTEAPVWWCEQLGTVLANEEVVDGKSEVGGFPVVRRPMRQWMLRITAYAERLLQDLDTIDWTDSLKEMQRNWIGRSEGAEVDFEIPNSGPQLADSKISNLKSKISDLEKHIRVFTTRPDTLFGATYMVLAPEHKLVDLITTPGQRSAVETYKTEVAKKSDLERTELAKEKTGVFTGAYAVNPVTGHEIPIWIADYVLISYGTGAIMAVPGHDTRDFEFATKFCLPIVQVVQPPAGVDWRGFVDDGVSVNSANSEISLNGLPTPEAKRKITDWLETKGLGKKTINYKLRDWLFSRQRYWGEPFLIIWHNPQSTVYSPQSTVHSPKSAVQSAQCAFHEALPESALPLLPPRLDDYKPTPDGQPPLARATEWLNLPDGSTRETNTMPQWAGSCWYYLRYLDARNPNAFVGKDAERYWMGGEGSPQSTVHSPQSEERAKFKVQSPKSEDGAGSTVHSPQSRKPTPGVDLYVGGTEHAVLHLLYARFWHKVLFDLGFVSTAEPFYKLVNQGLILGDDGQKMSKARGNVVNPDDILKEYGADAFRLYEMFMGPLEMTKPWSTKGVEGVYRFLGKVWRLFVDEQSEIEFEQNSTAEPDRSPQLLEKVHLSGSIKDIPPTPAQLKALHAAIKKVTEDLEGLRFNTAISALMVFINEAMTWEIQPASALKTFLILLQPFAPHLAEELWSKLNATLGVAPSALAYAPWPGFNPAFLVEDTIEIPVQVNGKLRDVIRVPADASQADLQSAALKAEKAQQFLNGKAVKKIIVVPKKLVNIVVG